MEKPNPSEKKIKKLLILRDIRLASSNLEKCVLMAVEHSIPVSHLVRYFEISRKKIDRGIQSMKEGRPIGIKGRPRLLNPSQEIELKKIIKDQSSIKDSLSPTQVVEEV